MRIAIGSDGWLHKEYINSPIVTYVKNKQVGFVTSIKRTKNKYCEIRAVIAWMPDISFYAKTDNNSYNYIALSAINEKRTTADKGSIIFNIIIV